MSQSWFDTLAVALPLALRMTAFLLSSAVLVPLGANWRLRAMAAIGLAAIMALAIADQRTPLNYSVTLSPVVLARETVLGLAMGLTSTLVMEAFRLAGTMILAGLAGPSTPGWDAQPGTPATHLLAVLGWSMFFLTRSHCAVMDHAVAWCRVYPPGEVELMSAAVPTALATMTTTFQLAWGIAMPLVLCQWIAQLLLAALARVAPVWMQWTSNSVVPLVLVWIVLGGACGYWTSVGWEPVAGALQSTVPIAPAESTNVP